MPRELLILRHGKSNWDVNRDDFHRPLSLRGMRSAQRIAAWMQTQDLIPDMVISSPATRAIDTATLCCKVMGFDPHQIVQNNHLYEASLSRLLEVLHSCPTAKERVLLVGHNPGLEELLAYLVPPPLPRSLDGKLLATGSMAVLKMPEQWHVNLEQSATLERIISPRDLPKSFPIPGGKPRVRPAYFYTQAGVIPYRTHEGVLEVLLITTSQDKRWLFPKGVHEPGLTAQQSASIEAFEEAGVEGRVEEKPLGTYRYYKWGANCEVTLYPMLVDGELSKGQLHEPNRRRKWVSVKEGLCLLDQDDLKDLLRKLAKRIEKKRR